MLKQTVDKLTASDEILFNGQYWTGADLNEMCKPKIWYKEWKLNVSTF